MDFKRNLVRFSAFIQIPETTNSIIKKAGGDHLRASPGWFGAPPEGQSNLTMPISRGVI